MLLSYGPREVGRNILSSYCVCAADMIVRVRLKIIGNLETMHDSDLPTFPINSLPIIFKRTVDLFEYESIDLFELSTTGS